MAGENELYYKNKLHKNENKYITLSMVTLGVFNQSHNIITIPLGK